jgi:hypothetical protein
VTRERRSGCWCRERRREQQTIRQSTFTSSSSLRDTNQSSTTMVVASSANKGKNKQPAQEEEVIVEQPALAHPKRSLQHLFLQALISRRTMEQGAAAAVYRHCVKLCGGQSRPILADARSHGRDGELIKDATFVRAVEDPEPDFLTWLLGLEPSLSQCGLEIKRGRADGREIIALVSRRHLATPNSD